LDKVADGTPTDITEAYYAARWQAHKIYIAVKVHDTVHYFTDSYTDWDAKDGIEFFIHTDGHGDLDYPQCKIAQQYAVGIKDSDHSAVWASLGNNTVYPNMFGFPDGYYENVIHAAGTVDGEWLYYEIEVTPFTYLGLLVDEPNVVTDLRAGDVIGLDVTAVGHDATAYTGVKAENLKSWKPGDWTAIGIHELAALPGDANLDGKVDVSDLGILAANYGTTAGATWDKGDFNGDGKVDVSDLGILAANYGTGTGGSIDFIADAKALGLAAGDGPEAAKDESPTTSLGCSSAGLPLIAGLALIGLMIVKLDE
jgi:hypothetical protein